MVRINLLYAICSGLTLSIICYSNAIKFTHEGKVGINLYVVPEPSLEKIEECPQKSQADQSTTRENRMKEEKSSLCGPEEQSRRL